MKLAGLALLAGINVAHAIPIIDIKPLTNTRFDITREQIVPVSYNVTNMSSKIKNLELRTVGSGVIATGCGDRFTLSSKQSCVLTLTFNGAQLQSNVTDGPIICNGSSNLQCYRPSQESILHIIVK